MINEAESLLRRSYDLEAGDLALSLSLATNAASKYRVSTSTRILCTFVFDYSDS